MRWMNSSESDSQAEENIMREKIDNLLYHENKAGQMMLDLFIDEEGTFEWNETVDEYLPFLL